MDTDHDALSRARGEKIEMKARDKVLVCKGGDGVRLLHITRIKMAGDCHSDWPRCSRDGAGRAQTEHCLVRIHSQLHRLRSFTAELHLLVVSPMRPHGSISQAY